MHDRSTRAPAIEWAPVAFCASQARTTPATVPMSPTISAGCPSASHRTWGWRAAAGSPDRGDKGWNLEPRTYLLAADRRGQRPGGRLALQIAGLPLIVGRATQTSAHGDRASRSHLASRHRAFEGREVDCVEVRLALRRLLQYCPERWPLEFYGDAAAQEKAIGRAQGVTAASTASSAKYDGLVDMRAAHHRMTLRKALNFRTGRRSGGDCRNVALRRNRSFWSASQLGYFTASYLLVLGGKRSGAGATTVSIKPVATS